MTAIQYLQQVANEPCTTRTLVAQGFLWAYESCRIDGTMAMALRRADASKARELLTQAICAGCDTMATAQRWLNANREQVLGVLA